MAVMQPKKGSNMTPPPEPTRTQPQQYKGVTVDSRAQPKDSLTTYLEGKSWIVDYYNQILGRDDAANALSMDLNPIYQQYLLVRGFEFRVTGDLSDSQDSETNELTTSGSANIYGVITPNKGDMFIADTGDGREGVFSITSVTRKSRYRDSAFEVEYELMGYNSAEVAADLNTKAEDVQYFDREYLRLGYSPILTEKTVQIRNRLEDHYDRLIALYFNDHYDREVRTLVVPGQAHKTYDPFLTQFVVNIIGTDEHPFVAETRLLNVQSDQAMYEMTLWSCLERMDYRLIPMAAQEMILVPTSYFKTMPMFNSIYYSKVFRVVYPRNAPTNADQTYRVHIDKPDIQLQRGQARFAELDRLIRETDLTTDSASGPYRSDNGSDAPQIHRVTKDSFYVLSEAFYRHNEQGGKLSALERLTLMALKEQPLDLELLDHLCEQAKYWDNVERFYYLPILFVLLRIYPRGL